ncbi:hypothetical protein QYE80_16710 [Pseudomonas tohonis]|uniref:hypothetical protein n=1 Tax=Pseudomonas solani TaxID=2731552 RepID=UPI0003971BBD|nr:hypothetical protein L682_07380 [Pseudomonas alcaligenes OT 69]MDN4146636.1 hypothetical protein [Pseudomonas tohonis]
MAGLSTDENSRRECFARHILRTWTRQDIVDWLASPKRGAAFREDMRDRLNRIKKEPRQ